MASISVKEELDKESDNSEEQTASVDSRGSVESTAQEPIAAPQSVGKRGVSKPVLLVTGAVVLGLLVGIVVLVNDRRELKDEVAQLSSKTQTTPVADEAAQLTAEVGKLIELPRDETPTIATVTDVSKLKNQAFFTNAQNGDKILIYSKAGKAILYRPSTKKVIDIAPINLGATQTQQGSSTTTTTNKR